MQKILISTLLLCCSCGADYKMNSPASFKKYSDEFKWITADGVRLKAREMDNYPKGDLTFWKEALAHHLEGSGYLKKKENCFKTKKQVKGCTLQFVRPYGAEDWVLSTTVFVIEDRIIIVEAAGPFERFQPLEAELEKALATFELTG